MTDADLSRLKIDKSSLPQTTGGRRRWFGPLLLLGIVLLVAGLYAAGLFTPAIEVEVATVARVYPSQGLARLNASGYVVAQRKAALAAKTTGRLEWLGVEEGSTVKAGEVVARLEDADFVAARDRARARLASARAAVEEARAEAVEAGRNRERFRQLLADRFVSEAEYDAADARHQRAQAALAAAGAEAGVAAASLREAEVALDFTRIRAPFAAVVLTKDADLGDIVTPIGAAAEAKAAVVTIADLDSLQVEADVAESNLGQVHLKQPCEIQLDALPESRFAGSVHMIVPTADRTKASVLVKVRFLERDLRVLPEMSARVAFLERELLPEERLPRTAVGRAAVVERDGRSLVFRLTDGRAQATPVTTGAVLGDQVEIAAGVQPGEQVVARPPAKLRDGARVKTAQP
jgi:RND family efflux transporter MFP subunit